MDGNGCDNAYINRVRETFCDWWLKPFFSLALCPQSLYDRLKKGKHLTLLSANICSLCGIQALHQTQRL